MKRTLTFAALIAALVFSFTPLASANHGGCPMGKGSDCGSKSQCDQKGGCPIANQLIELAHEALENQKDLGLTAEQVSTIRGLKIANKKREIQQMANMQIMMIDMKVKMMDENFDAKGLSGLVDQGSAAMADGAKQTIQDYGKLLKTLTAEQRAKLKEMKSGHHAKLKTY